MPLIWTSYETLILKCVNCREPIALRKIKKTRPLFAFLGPDAYDYKIETVSTKNLKTRQEPCLPNHNHKFDQQNLIIDF